MSFPAEPITREEAYLDAIAKGSGGGGGGTSDYSQLSNKPQINGTTLVGNKTASQLGLASTADLEGKVDKVEGYGLSENDYTDEDKASVATIAGKQDALIAGGNIKIDNDTISVNRWFVPAGKMVYTIITSDENYGQNVHVQRHTVDGAFIDDRTFLCEMYKTVTIDDLISIWNPYSEYRITLLEDSDEHTKGYSYTVNPISAATSTSFTFVMPQEENDNDLIIREELDAVSSAVSAIKDGTSIDSFADVETALAGKQATLTFDSAPTDGSTNPVESNGVYDALALKQDKTDNNLETTSKTVVGAINEHEGDIGSLMSGLTNYQTQNDLNLEVPNRKNLCDNSKNGVGYYDQTGTYQGDAHFATSDLIPVEQGKTYVASIFNKTTSERIGGLVYSTWDASKNFIAQSTSASITIGSGVSYVRIRNFQDQTSFIDGNNYVYQLEQGSTATAFAPYIPSVDARLNSIDNTLLNKFGLGAKVTDINAIKTSGFYNFTYNATGTPTNHSGILLSMFDLTGSFGLQIAKCTTESTVYIRSYDDPSFTNWTALINIT